MNRAWADDDEQSVILAFEDGLGLLAGTGHGGGCLFRDGKVVCQDRGGNERVDGGDAQVVGRWGGHAREGGFFLRRIKGGGLFCQRGERAATVGGVYGEKGKN